MLIITFKSYQSLTSKINSAKEKKSVIRHTEIPFSIIRFLSELKTNPSKHKKSNASTD